MKTVARHCEDKLVRLCRATGFAAHEPEFVEIFRAMSESWGARRVDEPAPGSAETCDMTPFELSVAWNAAGLRELRMAVEPQPSDPTPARCWEATVDLVKALQSRWGARAGRLLGLADLLAPPPGMVRDELGAGWYCFGVCFSGTKRFFKFWFSPDCQGGDAIRAVCDETMKRFGLGEAWRWTREQLPPTKSMLFGIDLIDEATARVKVYARLADPTLELIDRVAALATMHQAGDVQMFWNALGWERFPIMESHRISLHFCGEQPRPVSCTLQFPTYPFLPDDDLVHRCIAAAARRLRLPQDLYRAALEAMAEGRDLKSQTLLHSWVTFQRERSGAPRMTAYFPGRAYLEYGAWPVVRANP